MFHHEAVACDLRVLFCEFHDCHIIQPPGLPACRRRTATSRIVSRRGAPALFRSHSRTPRHRVCRWRGGVGCGRCATGCRAPARVPGFRFGRVRCLSSWDSLTQATCHRIYWGFRVFSCSDLKTGLYFDNGDCALTIRWREPGHRVQVAIQASCGPGLSSQSFCIIGVRIFRGQRIPQRSRIRRHTGRDRLQVQGTHQWRPLFPPRRRRGQTRQ